MRRTCSSNRAAALAALLLALAVTAPAAGQDLVDDGADLLDDAEQAHLSEYHTYLLADHDIDYRVVTIEAAEDIDLYAVRRFEDGAVGARSGTGRGLLLVVDPRQDRVRLEVGYALGGSIRTLSSPMSNTARWSRSSSARVSLTASWQPRS